MNLQQWENNFDLAQQFVKKNVDQIALTTEVY